MWPSASTRQRSPGAGERRQSTALEACLKPIIPHQPTPAQAGLDPARPAQGQAAAASSGAGQPRPWPDSRPSLIEEAFGGGPEHQRGYSNAHHLRFGPGCRPPAARPQGSCWLHGQVAAARASNGAGCRPSPLGRISRACMLPAPQPQLAWSREEARRGRQRHGPTTARSGRRGGEGRPSVQSRSTGPHDHLASAQADLTSGPTAD